MLEWVTATASAVARTVGSGLDRLLAPGDGVAPRAAGASARPVAAMPDSSAQGQRTV